MRRLGIVASVLSAALISVNCGATNAVNDLTAPSSVSAPSTESATFVAMGRGGSGGGGGGKGGKPSGGSGTLTLVMVTDNGNGAPNWGEQITFTASTTATDRPAVKVTCTQNGAVVYGWNTGYYADYPWPDTQIMPLRSDYWTSGAASCSAVLHYYSGTSDIYLVTLNFNVAE